MVLLDASMPKMDGFAVAARIKESPNLAGATIMMLTSGTRPGDAQRCGELGIAAHLTKPISQSDLWASIANVLGAAEATRVPLQAWPSPPKSQKRLRVLVAEDNAVSQRVAAQLLGKEGHEVEVASNGEVWATGHCAIAYGPPIDDPSKDCAQKCRPGSCEVTLAAVP